MRAIRALTSAAAIRIGVQVRAHLNLRVVARNDLDTPGIVGHVEVRRAGDRKRAVEILCVRRDGKECGGDEGADEHEVLFQNRTGAEGSIERSPRSTLRRRVPVPSGAEALQGQQAMSAQHPGPALCGDQAVRNSERACAVRSRSSERGAQASARLQPRAPSGLQAGCASSLRCFDPAHKEAARSAAASLRKAQRGWRARGAPAGACIGPVSV